MVRLGYQVWAVWRVRAKGTLAHHTIHSISCRCHHISHHRMHSNSIHISAVSIHWRCRNSINHRMLAPYSRPHWKHKKRHNYLRHRLVHFIRAFIRVWQQRPHHCMQPMQPAAFIHHPHHRHRPDPVPASATTITIIKRMATQTHQTWMLWIYEDRYKWFINKVWPPHTD